MNGASKDVREILTRLEKLGYVIARGGPTSTVGLVDPRGDIVRMPLGQPLTIHLTPGSSEAIDGLYNTLKKCGIDLEREEREKKESNKLANQREIQLNELAQRGHVLREKLKELMVKHDLRQTDVWHFADDYANTHDIEKPANSQIWLSNFLSGTNPTDKFYPYISKAVEAIESRGGKIMKAEEYRGQRSKPASRPKPTAEERTRLRRERLIDGEPDKEEVEVQINGKRVAEAGPPPQQYRAMLLALKVQGLLYRCVFGDPETLDITSEDIEGIAHEILEVAGISVNES